MSASANTDITSKKGNRQSFSFFFLFSEYKEFLFINNPSTATIMHSVKFAVATLAVHIVRAGIG